MKEIKFSHRYAKLKDIENGDQAWLLEVFESRTESLSQSFISYDTLKENGEYYALPRGRILILLFKEKERGTLFTTIRRHREKKADYYTRSRGELFEVIIDSDSICLGCGIRGICDANGFKTDCQNAR